MTRLASSWLAALALLSATSATALQVKEGVEGEVLTANISLREMTRLSVEGARVKTLRFRDGDLEVEKDDDTGQMFIGPGDFSGKPINAFLLDNKGRNFGLLLQPVDMPADSIVIKERGALRQSGGTKLEKSGAYERVVKNMVLAMAADGQPAGVEIREKREEVVLWKDTRLTLQRLYLAATIVGERYVLSNIGKGPVTIAEQELFRKGVLAISIETMNLAPGDSTSVFIVRERKLDE